MKALAAALLLAALATAQCAMCFRNAEAQSRARAGVLNRGIAVMALPLAGAATLVARVAYQRRRRPAA